MSTRSVGEAAAESSVPVDEELGLLAACSRPQLQPHAPLSPPDIAATTTAALSPDSEEGRDAVGSDNWNRKPFSSSPPQQLRYEDGGATGGPSESSPAGGASAAWGRTTPPLPSLTASKSDRSVGGRERDDNIAGTGAHSPPLRDVVTDGSGEDGAAEVSSVRSEDSSSLKKRGGGRIVSFFLENLGFRKVDDTNSSIDAGTHVDTSDNLNTATSGAAGSLENEPTDDALKLAVELVLRNPYMSTAEKMEELKDLHASIVGVAQAPDDSSGPLQEPVRFTPGAGTEALLHGGAPIRGSLLPAVPEGIDEDSPLTPQDGLDGGSSHDHFARAIVHRRGSRAGSMSEHIMQADTTEPSSPQFMRKQSMGESSPPPLIIERFRASSLLNDAVVGDQGEARAVSAKEKCSTMATSTLGSEQSGIETSQAAQIQNLFLDDRVHKIHEMFRNGQTRVRDVKLTHLSAELDAECSALDAEAAAAELENSSGDGAGRSLFPAKFSVRGKGKGVNLKLFGNGNIGDMWNFNRMNFPTIFGEEDDGEDDASSAVHKSTLFIRRHSIWMAFYTEDFPVRAIVMSDRVILFLPSGSGPSCDKFMLQVQSILPVALEGWKRRCGLERSSSDLSMNRAMQSGALPFELEVFRNIVYIVGSKHRKEYIALKKKVNRYLELLKVLKEGRRPAILSMGLESHSMDLRSEMERMVMHINSNMEALNDIVDDDNCDEYLALMNLSIFKKVPSLYYMNDQNKRRSILVEEMRRHSDLHSLQSTVDQYIMDAESVLSKVDQLLKHVQNEESQFRLQLNFSQNQILLLNTVLTIFACSVAFGSYFTGIFGMNLDNSRYFEKQSYSFVVVFGGTLFLIFAVFYSTLRYFTWRGVLPVIAGRRAARAAVAAKTGHGGAVYNTYYNPAADMDDLDRTQTAPLKERNLNQR